MKRLFGWLISAAMFVTTSFVPPSASAEDSVTYWTDTGIVAETFAEGSGTSTEPYKISNAAELAKIAYDANTAADSEDVCKDVYYELTADIDLSGHDWVPIAYENTRFFGGRIDGNGHVINNMTITTSYPAMGFIGSGSDTVVIENLGFKNADIKYKTGYRPDTQTQKDDDRSYSTGTVIGFIRGGEFKNVFVKNSVVYNQKTDLNDFNMGGFGGSGECRGTYGDSSSTRKKAVFTNCYVTGTTVKGTYGFHSGFIGSYLQHGKNGNKRIRFEFTNCYTAGNTLDSNGLAFMYFGYTSDLGNLYKAVNVYSADRNTYTAATEVATLNVSKSVIESAVTSGNDGMVADKGKINNGYPVCRTEANWLWDGNTASAFGGGDGTESNPYIINNGAQLAYLADKVYNAVSNDTDIPVAKTSTDKVYNAYTGTYFELGADIDLGNIEWKPIGRYGMRFNGHFDGKGHVISGLKITNIYHGIGLFGATGENTYIGNLGIEDADIQFSNGSPVKDYVENTDESFAATNSKYVMGAGALVAVVGGGTTENCYVRDSVVKNNRLDCSEDGGTGAMFGIGISAEKHDLHSSNPAYMKNCYAVNVQVQSAKEVGALAGKSGMGNVPSRCSFVMENCYIGGDSEVTVNSSAYNIVNQVVIVNTMPQVINCCSSGLTSKKTINESTVNGKTAASVEKNVLVSQMVDFENYYADNWQDNINDGYPVLKWQKTWEDPDVFDGLEFSSLSDENMREITNNVTLPKNVTLGGYAYNLSWTSSVPSVIGTDGKVSAALGDTDVRLTAENTETGAKKIFDVTVLGEITKALRTGLGTQDRFALTENITLPKTVSVGGTAYDIDWRTSDAVVLTAGGEIGKVIKNTPVCLSAYADSKVFKYNVAVAEQVSGKKVYLNENFEDYTIGTDISRADGWTNPKGTGDAGVNYTIEKDPTNETNKAIKVNRYYGKTGSKFYLNGAEAIDNADRNEAAMFVLDSDPNTDGNQPVTEGKIQFKASMMFATGEWQRMAIWFNGLNTGRDNDCVEIQFGSNVTWAKFDSNSPVYMSTGTNQTYEWYDVRVVVDLDATKYFLSVTRQDGITYTSEGYLPSNAKKSISSIGIHSRAVDDSIGSETKVSEWYADNISVTDITITDEEAVAYAKDRLTMQKTAASDLVLPSKGEENTEIMWSTNDSSVITSSGEVRFASEDKKAELTATISKGNAKVTKTFEITVPSKKAYEIKGLTVSADGSEMSEPTPGGRITAVKILNNYSKSAKMYVALYKNNRLESVSTENLNADAQSKEVRTVTLTNPVILPADLDGCEVKVFIWDYMMPAADIYSSDMPATTLWLLGDSIMTEYAAASYPQTGWGMVVGDYLSDKVTVKNKAVGGYTTASYLKESGLNVLSAFENDVKAGDYAVIGLGVNDSGAKNDISVEQYEENYRNIIGRLSKKGATCILTTTTITTNSSDTAPDRDSYSAQKNAVKKVAEDLGLVCIDISTEMANRFDSEIADGATMETIRDKYYVWDLSENGWDLSESTQSPDKRDGIHINLNGAKLTAEIFTDLLKVSDSKLGLYVK